MPAPVAFGWGEQDVARFEIAVDDPAEVGVVDCAGQGFDQPSGLSRRLGVTGPKVAEDGNLVSAGRSVVDAVVG